MSKPQQTFSEADLLSAGAQLCYIYTLHASNDTECRPRYVGFTCRPNYRGSEHHRKQQHGRKGEWVRHLLSLGEKAVLTIVHVFRSDDLTERILMEASWIEYYQNKFPDLLNDMPAGVGVGKMSESYRKKRCEIMKRVCNDPIHRKKKSEEMKCRYADPVQRAKMNEANRKRCASAADREKRSESMKKRWSDPVARKKQSETLKRRLFDPDVRQNYVKAINDPQWRKKHHEGMKRRCAAPEIRKQMSEASKKQFSNPEARKKAAEFAKQAWASPEYRAKRSATIARRKLQKELDSY